MEILLDNPLVTMYGPYFLVFYAFFNVFTLIILGIFKTRIDKTDRLGLPPIPSQIDPYEIAYLRGETNELARSVLFSLMQKGYLQMENDGKTGRIYRAENPNSRNNLKPIEKITLDWVGNSREASLVFGSSGLTRQLEMYGDIFKNRLEQQQMLVSGEMKSKMSRFRWIAITAIAALGLYKFLAAIFFGDFNFVGIIIMGVIGIATTFLISRLSRLTKLGNAYLERLQLAFDNLKQQAQKAYQPSEAPKVVPQASFAGVDPLLLSVGVFGSGILAGTVFDQYNQTFQKARNQEAGGSSCGAGCGSSCSSGDSGSSSSSGSSCGSGCGGCGGGCS